MIQFGPDAVGFFRVEVTDSGVGLTEDERKNIFGEFTQFNKNELQNGGVYLSSALDHRRWYYCNVTAAMYACHVLYLLCHLLKRCSD